MTEIDKTDFIIETEDDRFIRVTEGTGDNLLKEDVYDGYIDYVNYSIYETMKDAVNEENEKDGGMIMSKAYIENLEFAEILVMVLNQLDIEMDIDYEGVNTGSIKDAAEIVDRPDPEWDIGR